MTTIQATQQELSVNLKALIYQNFQLMKCQGFWYEEDELLLKKISNIFVNYHIIFFTCCALDQFYLIYTKEDIRGMVDTSYYLVIIAVTSFKNINFFKNMGAIKELLELLKDPILQPRNEEQRQMLLKYGYKMKILLKFCATLLIFLILVLVLNALSSAKQGQLVFELWLPFDHTKFPTYYIILIMQSLCYLNMGILACGTDITYCSFMGLIAVECDLISNSLTNLNKIARTNCFGKDYRIQLEKELLLCIIHHTFLLKFSNKFFKIIRFMLSIYFSVSVIIICTILFQLNKNDTTLTQMASAGMFFFTFMVEVFIFCFFGNLLISKSENIIEASFDKYWISASKRLKVNLMIFMIRLKHPIKCVFVKVFPLSFASFTSIISTTWKCFSVLRSTASD